MYQLSGNIHKARVRLFAAKGRGLAAAGPADRLGLDQGGKLAKLRAFDFLSETTYRGTAKPNS
jgi:hypothetical protein